MEILSLLFWLFTKHLVVDFFCQCSYMWKNKHNIRHPGGYAHAGLHAAVTLCVLLFYVSSITTALVIALAEAVIHYATDWSKMNLNSKMGWAPDTHQQYWWLLGGDQYVHTLTYLGIALVLV